MNEERPVVRFSNSGQNDQSSPPPPRPVVPPRERKGRAGCLVAGIVIGVVVVLGGLLILVMAMASMVSRGASAVVSDRESQQRFREQSLEQRRVGHGDALCTYPGSDRQCGPGGRVPDKLVGGVRRHQLHPVAERQFDLQ